MGVVGHIGGGGCGLERKPGVGRVCAVFKTDSSVFQYFLGIVAKLQDWIVEY